MTHNVLIVDDSLTVRMDLQEAFDAAGFHSRGCATVAAAKDALGRTPLDVIVLDVRLPDGDGIELLETIRNNDATAQAIVLMLSSESEVKDRIRGLRTGADEYIGKPYDTHYILARTNELLRAQTAGIGGGAGLRAHHRRQRHLQRHIARCVRRGGLSGPDGR
ncbi:MAG: response regulator [Aquabacterium sp.]